MIAIALNPGFALLAGALLALIAPQRLRGLIAFAAAVGSLALAFAPDFGEHAMAQIGLQIMPLRLDALAQAFGVLFGLVAILLALHGSDRATPAETGALLALAGGAMTAVFAGDFVSFVAAAELSTLAAVSLLLLRETWPAQETGARLLAWQALSGALFLAGAAFQIGSTGEASFAQLRVDERGGALILAALGVKCGFPVAHVWLKDALPRASAAGGAALVGYTTLLGLYGLARGYAGEGLLVWIGLAMAIVPAFFAMAEDDLRRALGYGLVVQAGLVTVLIGIGSPLAMAAAVAHAFTATLAAVLFAIALGVVQGRTGTARASALGGLGASMPVTALLSVVAGLCIGGAPGTAGFSSLALALDAVSQSGRPLVHLAVVAAIGAAVAHTAVKIPYAAFFAPARGKPAPPVLFGDAQLAMLGAAALIIGAGVSPAWLYAFLPSPIGLSPYELPRVAVHVQLAAFAVLGFVAARMLGLYPLERPAPLRDVDQLIHGPLWRIARSAGGGASWLHQRARAMEGWIAGMAGRVGLALTTLSDRPTRRFAPDGVWALVALAGALLSGAFFTR